MEKNHKQNFRGKKKKNSQIITEKNTNIIDAYIYKTISGKIILKAGTRVCF